jgi:DNA-binding response OmpR family regulator
VLGPASSVAQALALLARERPDAVTLDLNLLDGMAVPVADLLATMGVPFVVISAYDPAQFNHPALKQAPRPC